MKTSSPAPPTNLSEPSPPESKSSFSLPYNASSEAPPNCFNPSPSGISTPGGASTTAREPETDDTSPFSPSIARAIKSSWKPLSASEGISIVSPASSAPAMTHPSSPYLSPAESFAPAGIPETYTLIFSEPSWSPRTAAMLRAITLPASPTAT